VSDTQGRAVPALWAWDELVAAADADVDAGAALPTAAPTVRPTVTGVSIDTRTLAPGDLFVALTDARDGHAFVPAAFASGAAAALVRADFDRGDAAGVLLRVDDPLAALERIGRAARARLGASASVVAVTGSAGKTTTKEMLRVCFEAKAPGRVHASEKSYNNHWGVPLTLARMPASTRFAVFEIGMNHAGEIRPLTRMVSPHVALVTTVAPAHLGHFNSIEEIAEEKAEIFEGLSTGGTAILPLDNDHSARLRTRAEAVLGAGSDIRTFGVGAAATLRVGDVALQPHGSSVTFWSGHKPVRLRIGIAGRHNVDNAAACLIAWRAAIDRSEAAAQQSQRPEHEVLGLFQGAIRHLTIAPAGRGQVHELSRGVTLIDESYNANPASVRAALETLALYPDHRRRIAVLGDMLELGERSADLHAGLADHVAKCGVSRVFTCGPEMRHLFDALPSQQQGGWAATSQDLSATLLDGIGDGDVIVVKGSLGARMGLLTNALKDRYAIASGD